MFWVENIAKPIIVQMGDVRHYAQLWAKIENKEVGNF